jgi:hypothetical protein
VLPTPRTSWMSRRELLVLGTLVYAEYANTRWVVPLPRKSLRHVHDSWEQIPESAGLNGIPGTGATSSDSMPSIRLAMSSSSPGPSSPFDFIAKVRNTWP